MKVFWIISIGLRVITLLYPVGMSDDIFRYVWDGKVQHAGFNPFEFSPNAPEGIDIREKWWTSINNPHVSSPYPPFSQVIFWLITVPDLDITGYIFEFRLLVILIDICLIITLNRFIVHLHLLKRRLIIYAWSPLTIFELAGNGHNDGIASFFMILSIYWTITTKNKSKNVFAAIFLALAILTKTFPVFALPFLIRHWRIKEIMAFSATLIVFSLSYTTNKILFPLIPQGQVHFVKNFRFNSSIYRVLISISGGYKIYEIEFVLILSVVIVLILLIINGYTYWLTHSPLTDSEESLVERISFALFVLLLFSADVHPWYLLWILPLMVIKPQESVIIWSLTIFFSYEVYQDFDSHGIWFEKRSTLLLEYIPVFSMLIYQIATKWKFFKNSGYQVNHIKSLGRSFD
jgi:hypothetical protein